MACKKNPDDRRRARFAKKMTEALRAAGVRNAIRQDPEGFRLEATLDDGTPATMALANAFALFQKASPLSRGDVLTEYANSFAEGLSFSAPNDFAEARARLVLRVTTPAQQQVERWRCDVGGGGEATYPVCRRLTDGILLELAYDSPTLIAGMTRRELQAWGVSEEQAFAAAEANVWAMTKFSAVERRPSGLFILDWHDNFGAARITCVAGLLAQLPMTGRPVVIAPHRDVLYAAGAEDARALEEMAALARGHVDGPYFTGAAPALLDDDGCWTPYAPPADAPHADAWRALAQAACAREYAEQVIPLAAMAAMAAAGLLGLPTDPFVGSVMVEGESPAARTFCVWSEGVPGLLPRTDVVRLVSPQADGSFTVYGQVPWQALEGAVGHLMRPLGTTPERYYVDGFPSPSDLAALGLAAGVREPLDEREKRRATDIVTTRGRAAARFRHAR